MGLFGFGKKKKTEDPVSETKNEMMQEPPAEMPDGSASGVSTADEDELIQFYRMGLDFQDEGNDAAAFQYLKKAAEGGHVLAQFTLGTIFERGSEAVYQDAGQAVYWYRLAAEKGDPGAQFNLGYLYLQAEETRENGIAWMKKAAEQGDEAAQEYLVSLASETQRRQKLTEQHDKNLSAAKKILGRKQLYLLMSRATNRPYILEEGDYYTLFFSEEQRALDKCRELAGKGISCNPAIILKKDFPGVLASFYLFGCNAVRFDSPNGEYDVYLYDLVRTGRKNPNTAKPVENPKLVRSMLLSRQEVFKKSLNTEPDETVVKRYQEDIMTRIFQEQAPLLLAYILVDKDGEKIRAPFLVQRQTEGNPVRAVLFSGDDSFSRFKKKVPALRRKVITAAELKDVPLPEEVSSFIVDPDSASLLLNVSKKKA